MRKIVSTVAMMVVAVLIGAPAAMACGFLVSANGAVDLARTTTLVTWEDGIERYITNFEFAGDAESFGSITPLPAAPTDVRRAGDWTLQRLQLEVNPPPPSFALFSASAADVAGEAEVLFRTQVDALDVVVLKGGGAEVLAWVNDNGFDLPAGPETDHMLEFYGSRSPYFMATRFDAVAAAEDGFVSGDGIPVQVTIPIDRPWVPLHILHGASPDTEIIEADVFMLTPQRPNLLYGSGLEINRSEAATVDLLDDLRSDENMDWIPQSAWFTHLVLEAEAQELTYDLAVSVDGGSPSFVDAGFTRFEATDAHLQAMGLTLDDRTIWNSTAFLVVLAIVAGSIGGIVVSRVAVGRN